MEQEEALRKAAKDGDDLNVKILLGQDVSQTTNEMGDTPLLLATSCYITEPTFVNVVRSLIQAGADINHQNHEGNAAIHNASYRGSLEIVELLLDNGADIELEGEMQMVPLGLAATKKHRAVVNTLVKKLVEEKKFSRKQVEWMYSAENEVQQLHIYRALTSIFQQKEAMRSLLKFDVINVILRGIKRFNKPSVQSSGLQLLKQCVDIEEGLEIARNLKVGETINLACKDSARDDVMAHLIKGVQDLL